ncbi:24002_t:CDS:1, partial [Cetraspora pellucida]
VLNMFEVVEIDYIKYINETEDTSFIANVIKEVNADYTKYINKAENTNLSLSFEEPT